MGLDGAWALGSPRRGPVCRAAPSRAGAPGRERAEQTPRSGPRSLRGVRPFREHPSGTTSMTGSAMGGKQGTGRSGAMPEKS